MGWQDILISIASIIFAYSIIPQIGYCYKTKKGLVNLQLSILTTIGMIAVTVAYFTLHLYFSGIIRVFVGLF
ncbi:hypothetical protein COV15_02165 [Candidatus Woesearchaeota archaeon CG10_big_fil_rev_8_21_14_0_10_34_12]|nr:MAG: hypothetical protein COV15_02165 [Candidatus Woesearchaeota archaeon CG10_big_fil_rev_8_21_14_0_10_34_12]